jgi:hypothetical protein
MRIAPFILGGGYRFGRYFLTLPLYPPKTLVS